MKTGEIDSSSGVMFPFFDHDTNVLFLAGKVRVHARTSFVSSLRRVIQDILRSTLQYMYAIYMNFDHSWFVAGVSPYMYECIMLCTRTFDCKLITSRPVFSPCYHGITGNA